MATSLPSPEIRTPSGGPPALSPTAGLVWATFMSKFVKISWGKKGESLMETFLPLWSSRRIVLDSFPLLLHDHSVYSLRQRVLPLRLWAWPHERLQPMKCEEAPPTRATSFEVLASFGSSSRRRSALLHPEGGFCLAPVSVVVAGRLSVFSLPGSGVEIDVGTWRVTRSDQPLCPPSTSA